MKVGCFGSSSQIPMIERAGFDNAELDICEIAAMDEASYKELKARIASSPLGFKVFSGFMPLSERIHEAGFDSGKWFDHAERSAERTAELGAEIWTFGAGKCRSIPEGISRADGEKQVLEFVHGICERIAPYKITLVVEPLGPVNSNYLNYIGEAVDFIKKVDLDNCKTMCDLRHMHKLSETLSDISRYVEYIKHAHIDYPDGDRRLFPMEGDGFDYVPYLKALKESGYQGDLTVEATAYDDFEAEAGKCVSYLHKLNKLF